MYGTHKLKTYHTRTYSHLPFVSVFLQVSDQNDKKFVVKWKKNSPAISKACLQDNKQNEKILSW